MKILLVSFCLSVLISLIVFIISEEDKKSPTSLDYWFKCIDLDEDGFIKEEEMQFFFEEQQQV